MLNYDSIEKKIKELIKDVPTAKHGYQFHRFTVDFAIPALKIFIECDGAYWHSLPAAIQRDQEKDRMAAEDGWFMLRLTEKEINEDIAGCEAKIKRAIALRAAETSDPIVTLDLTLSES